MPKLLSHALTPSKIAAATPKMKATQLTDGRGLYIKLFWGRAQHQWRFDFVSPLGGKRKTMVLGDALTSGDLKRIKADLEEARTRAEDLRRLVSKGICPAEVRNDTRQAQAVEALHVERKVKGLPALGTFEAVARELIAIKYTEGRKSNSVGKLFATRWLKNLERHAFPKLGKLHVKDIQPVQVLDCIQALENEGKMETARMVRRYCAEVFERAIVLRLREWNPANSIKGSVRKKQKALTKNFAAVLDPAKVGELMAAIAGYTGHSTVRECLLTMAYTFQRPGNVRFMEWSHIDFAKAEWTIPAANLKQPEELKRDARFFHVVPLSRQMVAMLKELRAEARDSARFVFENTVAEVRHIRPIGANTPTDALGNLGFTGNKDMTAHGFRAVARTIGKRECKIAPEVLEAQLAHSNGDSNGTAYDREKYMPERKAAMQTWADYLDKLRKDAKPLKLVA